MAIIRADIYTDLQQKGVPMRVVAKDSAPHRDRQRHQAMNLSTFAFIITGVLLNAAAQLLLKAGTNALGGAIHLTAQNWFATGIKVITQLPILAGLACYGISRGGVDHRPVARRRVASPTRCSRSATSSAPSPPGMFLGEVVSVQRMLALGVIIVGVALLART